MGMNGKERLMHIKESLMALAEGQLHEQPPENHAGTLKCRKG